MAVSQVPYPDEDAQTEATNGGSGMAEMLNQIIAGVVLLAVTLGLLFMTRRRGKPEPEPAAVEAPKQPELSPPEPAGGTGSGVSGGDLNEEVQRLVNHQPEEVAVLLRSWLADRRAG